jgi:hypothetical protein
MGLSPYLRSLEAYRREMAQGMMQAAQLCGLELDAGTLAAFKQGQETLRSIADSFDSRANRPATKQVTKKATSKKPKSE